MALVAVCARAGAAPSDEEELALAFGDQLTVSIAAGMRQPLREAPAVASVITAEAIRAMGAVDLDEVLQTVAGLHVGRSSNQYMPLYVFCGIYSQFTAQVLVLQNGVPMTTLFVGNKGNVWAGYPVEHIERIEVIRGPGSALYGADAFAGVINFITKFAADTPGTRVGLRAGSFGTRDAWVLHGGRLGPMEVPAYLRVGDTDGARSLIERDWSAGLQASVLRCVETTPTPCVLLPPGTALGAGHVFTDGLIGAPARWERQSRVSGFAIYSGFGGHSLRVGLGHDDLDLYKTTELKNANANANANDSRIGTGRWADVTDFTGTVRKFMLPQFRQVDCAYVQDEWHLRPDRALLHGTILSGQLNHLAGRRARLATPAGGRLHDAGPARAYPPRRGLEPRLGAGADTAQRVRGRRARAQPGGWRLRPRPAGGAARGLSATGAAPLSWNTRTRLHNAAHSFQPSLLRSASS